MEENNDGFVDLSDLIEVTLAKPDDFLKVVETLSRIGVGSYESKVLNQSCHILHKRGKYYIVHFKQLFMLDGRPSSFCEDDRARLNTIAAMLDNWGLVKVIDKAKIASPRAQSSQLKVIPFREKKNWTLVEKYSIGNRNRRNSGNANTNNEDQNIKP